MVRVRPLQAKASMTYNSRLCVPDNYTPIRWMGVWCAVYAPYDQEKADGGGEISRTRRGTKSRGGGSASRRKLARMVMRAPTRKKDPPRRDLRYYARVAAYKRAALDRAIKYRNKLRLKRDESAAKLLSLKLKTGEQKSANPFAVVRRTDALVEALKRQISNHSKLEKHLLELEEKIKLRLTVRIEGRPDRETISSFRSRGTFHTLVVREGVAHAESSDRFVNRNLQRVTCQCKACRCATTCPFDHGIHAGDLLCTRCGFRRHEGRVIKSFRPKVGGKIAGTSAGFLADLKKKGRR